MIRDLWHTHQSGPSHVCLGYLARLDSLIQRDCVQIFAPLVGQDCMRARLMRLLRATQTLGAVR